MLNETQNKMLDDVIEATQSCIGFESWLRVQKDRADWVGVLASEMAKDPGWPTGKNLAAFHRHLEEVNACEEAHKALDLAWTEFLER